MFLDLFLIFSPLLVRRIFLPTALLHFVLLSLSCIFAIYFFLILMYFLRVLFVVLRLQPLFCLIDEISDSEFIFHSKEEENFVEYEN